jgi:ubiquinone/menaquinone biosynthesis C-methylase UbiE
MARFKRFKLSAFAVCLFLASATPSHARQLASRATEEWIKTLENPQRIQSQKINEVIARLALKPGQVVADIGAGSGLFSRPLAKAVAPSGKVYAVDIDKGLLDYINHAAKEQNIGNIQTVLGEFDDPKIPNRNVDMAFINDVLHHIEHREAYLKALGTYIKPGGRLALIEMNKNDPNTPHRGQPELLVSREDIEKWMSNAGFKLVQEYPDLFPGTKWFLIYGKK